MHSSTRVLCAGLGETACAPSLGGTPGLLGGPERDSLTKLQEHTGLSAEMPRLLTCPDLMGLGEPARGVCTAQAVLPRAQVPLLGPGQRGEERFPSGRHRHGD